MTGEIQHPATAPSDEGPAATPTSPAGTDGPGARQRFARAAATAGSPKLRAIALIVTVSVLLITIVCAPFGALPWWSPILMLAASGGSFYWCRASAMAAAAPARPSDARRAPHSAPRGGVKLPTHAKPVPTPAPVPVAKATMPTAVAEAPAPQARVERVFDVNAADAAPAAPAAPVQPVVEDADAWQPVAVPPPTYTMKERAPERPQQTPVPAPGPKSYEHVANEDLPFDGLALDQDVDDLPSVFRAG